MAWRGMADHNHTTDEDSIASAASEAATHFDKKSHHLHLALCIPGILYPEKSPAQIDATHALHTLQVNTLGPLLLIKHFSPFLPKKAAKLSALSSEERGELQGLPTSAVWANMSARVGSITDNTNLGGWYSYRASKAGVNQVTRTFDNFLKMQSGENAMSVALHPGTVKTGLSKEFWGNVKEEKLFSPEFAAGKLMEVIRSRGVGERGRCWDWKGEEIPP